MTRKRRPARLLSFSRGQLGLLLLAGLASSTAPSAAQSVLGLHGIRVAPDPAGAAVTTAFLQGRVDETGQLGRWDWRVEGAAWLDAGDPDASVVALAEANLGRRWGWGGLRAGVGELPWGLSGLRSPAAQASPVGLLWSSVSTPAIGNPFLEVSTRVRGMEVEAVFLPLRPPLQPGRLADVTWDRRRLDAPDGWEVESGYGLRLWRSFDAVDAGLWWVDAGDRRPWIAPGSSSPAGGGGRAQVRHPGTRQLGATVEGVLGPTVFRGEGSLARRDGAWHSRGVLGVEWFATPYLTLLLEQGLASDRDEAASPLVDDAVLGLQLLAERIRFQAGLAVDPESGTRHTWSTLRWTVTSRGSVELEWAGAWGGPEAESSSALRQPRALRLGGIWYF